MTQNGRADSTNESCLPIYTRSHTSCDNKATAHNSEFSVVKRWSASLPWQRDKMKKEYPPMVSAGKSGQYSISAVESLLFCVSNLVTCSSSADTYKPIQKWWWNSILALSLLLNRKWRKFKFSLRFCIYKSGSKSNPRDRRITHIPRNIWMLWTEWHSHVQCRYHHFYSTFTCKLMFASGTCAAIPLKVLGKSPDLCSAQSFVHSFNPSTQDLSGTKDASFFLERKKEMVTHQFLAVLCDMSYAREIYLYL